MRTKNVNMRTFLYLHKRSTNILDDRVGEVRREICARCGGKKWKLIKITRSEIWNPSFRDFENVGRHYECQKCKRIEVVNTQERIKGI